MSEHTRALVRQFIDRMERNKAADAFGMLNPDGRITIIGKTEVSGTFTGPEALFAHLSRFESAVKTWPEYRFSAAVVVDGDQAFLRASGGGEGLYGAYEQPHYGYYMRVEGEGFAEIIEYMDPTQLELAFLGRKLVPA